jgi:hypothetical protein
MCAGKGKGKGKGKGNGVRERNWRITMRTDDEEMMTQTHVFLISVSPSVSFVHTGHL